MNTATLARTAYAAPVRGTRTPRENEYEILARITHRLRNAGAQAKTNFAALAQAIHENRSLWTALAVDVADHANALPPELKARILYLAEFTMRHSQKVLIDGAEVEPLVFINTTVMRGLRSEGDPA